MRCFRDPGKNGYRGIIPVFNHAMLINMSGLYVPDNRKR